jgi:ParB family chromosome partitioning protein
MKVQDIPLEQIEVSDRRRQDYGDIGALAKGMKTVGLLEPIIVDRNSKMDHYRLVAGERRLQAARMLKWRTIPANLLEHLAEEELREIELEENENRKSLTEAERRKTFRAAKQTVESAKKAAEVLAHSGPKPQAEFSPTRLAKIEPGLKGRPVEAASTRVVADALGISHQTVRKAEQQVELSERYPWLQSDEWRQADVLRLRRHLERIPAEEQDVLCWLIQDGARPFAPRPDRAIEYAEVVTAKTPEARAEIYRLSRSADKRERDLGHTRALHRPPMPDARIAYITETLPWLAKAVKPLFAAEPETQEFHDIIARLKRLKEIIQGRYEELKKQEAKRVEADLRRIEEQKISQRDRCLWRSRLN